MNMLTTKNPAGRDLTRPDPVVYCSRQRSGRTQMQFNSLGFGDRFTFADLKFNQGFFCVFANKRIFAFKIDGVTAITPDDVEFAPPQNMEVSL